MTIFGSPASSAVKVTCACRIEEKNPRNIASEFLSLCDCLSESSETCFICEIQSSHLNDLRIYIIKHAVCILHPFTVGITEYISHPLKCLRFPLTFQSL